MQHQNKTRLDEFVSGHIAIAAKKSPRDAAAHLRNWARHLETKGIAELLATPTPDHMAGLDANDILFAALKLTLHASQYMAAA